MICSKKEFDKYLEVQREGLINMFNVEQGTTLTGLSKEKYIDILKNYKQYKKQYYGNN